MMGSGSRRDSLEGPSGLVPSHPAFVPSRELFAWYISHNLPAVGFATLTLVAVLPTCDGFGGDAGASRAAGAVWGLFCRPFGKVQKKFSIWREVCSEPGTNRPCPPYVTVTGCLPQSGGQPVAV